MYKIYCISPLLFVQVLLAPMMLPQDQTLPGDSGQNRSQADKQDENQPVTFPANDQVYRENANDDIETKLMKEKIRAAFMEIQPKKRRVLEGQDSVVFLFESQKRLIDALLEFHKEPAKVISFLELNVEIAKQMEAHKKLRYERGMGRLDDYAMAKYFRADAELRLLRAKKRSK